MDESKRGLRLVTEADRHRLQETVDGAKNGTEPITDEERRWLDQVTRQMGLAQVACRQRDAINCAVEEWEGDLARARRQGWAALAGGMLLGLALGAVLWLLGRMVA